MRKYKREDFPIELKLSFNKDDVDYLIKKEKTNWLATIIMLIGFVVTVVGAYFIMFGPSTIVYNRFEGMSYMQMMQAYPGPLASIGFAIIMLSRVLFGIGEEKMDPEWITNQIHDKTAFDILNLPDDEELSIALIETRLFRVDIIKKVTDKD